MSSSLNYKKGGTCSMKLSRLNLSPQQMQAFRNELASIGGDWKNTSRKRSSAYFCYGPDKETGKPKVYFISADGKRSGTLEDLGRELVRPANGGTYELYDGSPLTSDTFKSKAVACKTGGAMIPWTALTYSGDTERLKAKYFEKGIPNMPNERGTFVIYPAIDHNSVDRDLDMPSFREEPDIVSGVTFAKMYDLTNFPTIFSDIDTSIERPAELFEQKTADDELKVGAVQDRAQQIEKNFEGVETYEHHTEGAGERTFYIEVSKESSATTLTLQFSGNRKDLFDMNLVEKFRVVSGMTGSTMDETSEMAQKLCTTFNGSKVFRAADLIKKLALGQ